MKLSYLLAIGLVGLSATAPAVNAKPGNRPGAWTLLGFKTVSGGTDRDSINVRGNARYRQLELCSFNAPIHIVRFTVRFENGGRQDVDVRNVIGARSCTRAIDLKGNARNINRIDLTYERVQRGMRVPLVRVMAR